MFFSHTLHKLGYINIGISIITRQENNNCFVISNRKQRRNCNVTYRQKNNKESKKNGHKTKKESNKEKLENLLK